MADDKRVMSRGIDPHRMHRQPMIEVNCPACNVTIDTVAAPVLRCPNCLIVFDRETGRKISGVREKEDK
jgi:hypothetical protein